MSPSWALRVSPRDWQRCALERWRAAGDRGVVAVVTGGGKTIFAYACILDLRERNANFTTTILVPTLALLDQWVVGLTEDLGVQPFQVSAFSGRSRPAPGQVNVVVINSARELAPGLSDLSPTFLIVDECHRAASPENARALDGKHIATLGLSATPEREFDDLFLENVVPPLGPILYRYGYEQALIDRVITPFSLTNVAVPMQDDEQSRYDKYTRQLFPLFKERDAGADVDLRLQRVLRDRARISSGARLRIPATLRLLHQHRRERAIVFHEQIAAADEIVRNLKLQRHRSAAYHSGLGVHLRQDNLRLFRRGEIDVLVTCRALDEGINVPDASVAVIAASTSSTRQRIQRLGRVLRPAPGKTNAEVYTLYASEPEAERLRREAAQLAGVERIRWLTIKTA